MATFAPAIVYDGYGVGEIQPGDTVDPAFLPALGTVAFGALTGVPADNAALTSALDAKSDTGHTHAGVYQPAGSYAAAVHTHVKSDVGLANVDNTADTAKPVSTAQQTALDAKASLPLATLVVPLTAQTRTFNILKAWEIIANNHTATIAAQTFVFPTDANSQIGQELRIFSRSIITAVTLTLNGNTIIGTALTTLPANGNVAWRKVAANLWARIQ